MIQARMESTRLCGKVLKEILGKPMLWYLINRLKHAKLLDQIVLATSGKESDEPILKFAKKNDIAYYAGSELDLLDRIYQAAKKFEADAIVRITADCPLIDPEIVDKVIKYYLDKGPFDYVSNARPKATYPVGLDTEVYSFKALEKAWEEVKDTFRREWLSTNFFECPEKYRLGLLEYEEDLSYMRWTVDYQASQTRGPVTLEVNEKIRLVGEVMDENEFKATIISPWEKTKPFGRFREPKPELPLILPPKKWKKIN